MNKETAMKKFLLPLILTPALLAACGGGTPAPALPKVLTETANISVTRIDVRTNPVDVGKVTLNISAPGKVVVTFSGDGTPDTGDRLVLAASDESKTWGVNDGNVSIKASGAFSHTRSYTFNSAVGPKTFYAVAHNYVDTKGNGQASIYATLTATFYPN
jgi:hypothetical protein